MLSSMMGGMKTRQNGPTSAECLRTGTFDNVSNYSEHTVCSICVQNSRL